MPRIVTTASPLPPPLPAVAWPFAGAAVAAGIAAGTEDTDAWRCEGEHAILCGGEPLLQAGVIDWIAALVATGVKPETLEGPSGQLPYLGALLKREQDLAVALRRQR